jgi:hypothetical protein
MEEVYIKGYRSFEKAEENMGEFIEKVYNGKILHSGRTLPRILPEADTQDSRARS